MAKKKPMTDTSTATAQSSAPAAVATAPDRAPEKAAVNVDTKQESPKSKKNGGNKAKKSQDKPNIFKRMLKGIKGIFSELKKVTWPKGKEVVSNTAVVLVVVVLFFVILFVIDYVLAGLLGVVTTDTHTWTHLWN